MAAALKIPEVMTVEQFLNWASPGSWLWQLIDGMPVAMSPPSPRHGAIQGEIAGRIWAHLRAKRDGCSLLVTPGVIPPFQSDRNFMIPDLAVTCTATDMDRPALRDPVLIVEILSPSNHAETWRNVWAYMTIPALREILVVRTAAIGVELLRRNADGSWPDQPLSLTDNEVTLDSIGLTLPIPALYRSVGDA